MLCDTFYHRSVLRTIILVALLLFSIYPALASGKITLTKEEQAWLALKHTIRVRVNKVPPFMFIEPKPSGIAIDYFNHVAQRVGLDILYVTDTIGFPKSLQDLEKERRHFDLILHMRRTPERDKKFALSNEYILTPQVIITRDKSSFVSNMRDLEGKTVVVERGYMIIAKLQQDYPGIQLLECDSTLEALKAVSTSQGDAYLGNLTKASYLIRNHGFGNLKVAAPTPYKDHNQVLAVRKDWPELVTIFNKVIAQMTPEEHQHIQNKWLTIDYEYGVSIADVLKWILGLVSLASVIIIIILFWNRRLNKKIKKRLKTEQALKESENRLENFYEAAFEGIVISEKGKIKDFNNQFAKIIGYRPDELVGVDLVNLVAEEDREMVL